MDEQDAVSSGSYPTTGITGASRRLFLFVLADTSVEPVMPLPEFFWTRADARAKLNTMRPEYAANLRVRRAKLVIYDK